MNTKIRTIITTGLASLSFAGAAVAPAISQAEPRDEIDHITFCAMAQTEWQNGIREAAFLRSVGEFGQAGLAENKAIQAMIASIEEKCEWIGAARQAKAVSVVVSPTGTITSTPPVTTSPVKVVKSVPVSSLSLG